MLFAQGTYVRMTGLPSSTCSRAIMPGSRRGDFSESTRAGMSGRATLRTRVRFIVDSAWVFEANASGHAGTQAAAIAEKFDKDFKGAARRVDDGTDFLHAGSVFFAGRIRRANLKLLALMDAAEEFFREGNPHLERRFGGNPEKPLSFGNALPLANVAAGNQAIKGSSNPGFFHLEFERAF